MDVSFPTQLELMKIQHLAACHHPAAGYCTHTCCVGAPGLNPLGYFTGSCLPALLAAGTCLGSVWQSCGGKWPLANGQ